VIPLPKTKGRKAVPSMPVLDPSKLARQLGEQRRTVDFDSFDIHVQQLLGMLEEEQIGIAPAYQRQFRWGPDRCSELVESLMLGIPIPNIFMATNPDNTWEVVDGLQRLSAIVKFAGSEKIRRKLKLGDALIIQDLKKLDQFNGLTYDTLPANIQLHFRTRPMKVVTLNDKSDKVLRFDLFERLNTGGITLTAQEIRDCVYQGPFADMLDELASTKDFRTVVKLTSKQRSDGTAAECVLRLFAFLDRYQKFDHSVKEFLNGYMKAASDAPNVETRKAEFAAVFRELARAFPKGITRSPNKNRTPLNLFEGVAVGAALALKKIDHLVIQNTHAWMSSETLKKFTTAATNDRTNVRGRIEFCRDRFLGKPHVPAPKV
jgi:hypothetical protein